jgi:hypothetical protein
MGSGFVSARGLPDAPLDAAAEFHARILPSVREVMTRNTDLAVMFDPADHTHRAWRVAAIQGLAREAAPCRINGIVGHPGNLVGTAEALNFVHANPGITGQLLAVGRK